MGLSRAKRLMGVLLALLVVTMLGMSGVIFARMTASLPAAPSLPERVEWHGDPHSGSAALLLHGLTGNPEGGVLMPHQAEVLPFPGLPEVWRELSVSWQSAPLPEERDGFDGLQLFDVDNKPGLASLKWQPLSGNPINVAIRGQRIWLVCTKSGLSVLDLADPLTPLLRQVWPAPWVTHAAFSGKRAFLLDTTGRLEIVELTPAGRGRLVARHALQQTGASYEGLTVHHGRLLLLKKSSDGHRWFLSFCTLTALGQGDTRFVDVPLAVPYVMQSWWQEGRLYLKDNMDRLSGVDIGNPLRPRIFLETELPTRIERLVWSGDRGLIQLADNSIYGLTTASTDARTWVAKPLGQEHQSVCVLLVYATGRVYAFSRDYGIGVLPELPDLPGVQSATPGSAANLAGVYSPEAFLSRDVLQVVPLSKGLAVLDSRGRVQLFGAAARGGPEVATFAAGEDSRWLAVHDDRLYVGGGKTITVMRLDGEGHLTHTGELAIPGGESFDAVVVDGTLCVASGRQGVVGFSLADPDRPVASPAGGIPLLLQQRLYVKSVVAQGHQLFAAGSAAGILILDVGRDHRLTTVGIRPMAAPVYAMAVAGKLLLAATKTSIQLLAMEQSKPAADLQSLGTLPIKNVKRLTVLDHGFLGVRQAVGGWQRLPLPVLMTGQAGEPPRLRLATAVTPGSYRLLLFNRDGMAEYPTMLTVPPPSPIRQGV